MPEEFKVGDVVQLKSGSPEMTIANIKGDDIGCTWFQENIFKSYIFDKKMLIKVEEKSKEE